MQFCSTSRPFADVDEMNNTIETNWNQDVGPNDLTYILGDITFGKINPTIDFLHRLNGRKILIVGNHDDSPLEKRAFRECFESIHDYKELKMHGHKIVLFHYPIEYWNGKHHGSLHLHGHMHGNKTNTTGRIKDVGMDTNNCRVYNLDALIMEMLNIPLPEKTHHE